MFCLLTKNHNCFISDIITVIRTTIQNTFHRIVFEFVLVDEKKGVGNRALPWQKLHSSFVRSIWSRAVVTWAVSVRHYVFRVPKRRKPEEQRLWGRGRKTALHQEIQRVGYSKNWKRWKRKNTMKHGGWDWETENHQVSLWLRENRI